MIQSTKLAKTVYWLSCKVSHIKSYTQTWRIANEEEWLAAEGDIEAMFQPAGRRWSSIKLTWTLMDLAHRLDRKHADHWMYVHTNCGPVCDECGGQECPDWGDETCSTSLEITD